MKMFCCSVVRTITLLYSKQSSKKYTNGKIEAVEKLVRAVGLAKLLRLLVGGLWFISGHGTSPPLRALCFGNTVNFCNGNITTKRTFNQKRL